MRAIARATYVALAEYQKTNRPHGGLLQKDTGLSDSET
jgi:hypothetical protein